jgi:hypothetical protein
MPKLSRSALYQCLRCHGLSKIGRTAKCSPLTSASLAGPYCFEITANEVVFREGDFGVVFPVLLAVEEVTKHLYMEVDKATPESAAAFLAHLVVEFPQKIIAVTTDVRPCLPTGELRSTETWRRSVLTPLRSPAAPVGSSRHGQFCPLKNPLS